MTQLLCLAAHGMQREQNQNGKLGGGKWFHLLPGRCTGMRLWPESRILSKQASSSFVSADNMKTCASCVSNWKHSEVARD